MEKMLQQAGGGQPKALDVGLGAELVSPGHWGCSPQVSGRSRSLHLDHQGQFSHAHGEWGGHLSPICGGQLFYEGWGQLFCYSVQEGQDLLS